MVAQGSEKILWLSGVLYGAFFIAHAPIERAVALRVRRPLLAYGVLVVLNGLLVEVLAYQSNLDRIRAGRGADLFATTSLAEDLLISIPYYVVNAGVLAWVVRRFAFTTFELAAAIWAYNAVAVDAFKHVIALFAGDVLGFLLAGVVMLFTLHAPIRLFDDTFRARYPDRSRSWAKYPIGFALQLLPLAATFVVSFLRFVVFDAR